MISAGSARAHRAPARRRAALARRASSGRRATSRLALARRGHLEALVEPEAVRVPGGADAVFRVRAGPRVRVGRSRVEGAEDVAGAAPRRAGAAPPGRGLPPGEGGVGARRDAAPPRRGRPLEGRGRAARDLRPRAGRHGPRVPGRPGAADEPRGPRRGAARASSSPRCATSCARAGRRATASRRGPSASRSTCAHRATARPSCARRREPRGPGEAVVYDLRPGPRAIVSAVELRDADPLLLAGLRTQPGRPLDDVALEEDARLLVSRLEERGHFEASVEPEVPEGGGSLAVVFLARPGPRAVVARGRGRGPAPAALRRREGAARSSRCGPALPYRLRDVARSRDTLLAAWRRAGYLDARVRPEVTLSEARDEAARAPGGRARPPHDRRARGARRARPHPGRHRRARDGAAPRRALLLRARAREPAAALRPRHLRARVDRRARPGARRGAATWW